MNHLGELLWKISKQLLLRLHDQIHTMVEEMKNAYKALTAKQAESVTAAPDKPCPEIESPARESLDPAATHV